MWCWASKVNNIYLVSEFENNFQSDLWCIFQQWLFYTIWFWGGRLYSAKADEESYIWAEITPRSSMGWGRAACAGAGSVRNLVNVSAVRPSDKEGQLHPGLCSKPVASRLREVTLSLYFWSILASSVQRRHCHGGPVRGHQDELGGWRPSQGKWGLQGCCMALWLPNTRHSHCSWSVSASLSLSRCFLWCEKQQTQIATREVSTWYRKKDSSNQEWSNVGKDCLRDYAVSIPRVIKNLTRCVPEGPPLTDPGLNRGLEQIPPEVHSSSGYSVILWELTVL